MRYKPVTLDRVGEPAKLVADGLIGSLGIAFWIQGVTLLTAVAGLLLILFRLAIASQEFRLNRRKLIADTIARDIERDIDNGELG